MTEREAISWESFDQATQQLAKDIVKSGYRPDVIVTIVRGGLPLSSALAYSLSVRNVLVVNVRNQDISAPGLFDSLIEDLFDGARVLVTDDVTENGLVLGAVMDACRKKAADVRAAVLVEKPNSAVKCDYVWKYSGAWFVLPWSNNEPPA